MSCYVFLWHDMSNYIMIHKGIYFFSQIGRVVRSMSKKRKEIYMINTNLAQKIEETTYGTSEELGLSNLEKDMMKRISIAQKELFDINKKLLVANDNIPENPKDPSAQEKLPELLEKKEVFNQELEKCKRLIQEKGLSKEAHEVRFQTAFKVAENCLRCELEIANIIKMLPSNPGCRTELSKGEGIQTKTQFIESVYGLPYMTAWRISKLTEETVEQTIQYAKKYKELPTRRLASIVSRKKDFEELHAELKAQREQKKLERKAKKEAAEEASIHRGIDDFNAIQNPLPNVGPNDTYNIVYADPSEKSLNELKTYIIPASENSILFMWSPANKLEERLDLMKTWGFSYKENAVWDRMDSTHTGQYFSNQHDLLLVGVKGTGLTPRSKEKSICRIPLKEGETKPEYYTELIKTMYPGQPWLDVMETINAGKEV